MDYEGVQALEGLLRDSSATEFHENVLSIPTDKMEQDFYQWVDVEAPEDWGSEYVPMLAALSRLVRADTGYDTAMAQIRQLQESVRPAEETTEDAGELTGDQAPEEVTAPAGEDFEDEPPPPGDAAKAVAQQIAVPIIKTFQEEHAEMAARMRPEELMEIAIDGAVSVIR